MADTVVTKKVTDLAESTAPNDNDLFPIGANGTASLRKMKWSNIWAKILSLITSNVIVNNLITTASGKALDARQGKVLDGKISKLNTDIVWKLAGTAIGTGSSKNVAVPIDATDILVMIYIYATNASRVTLPFHINPIYEGMFVEGYHYDSDNYASVCVNYTNDKVVYVEEAWTRVFGNGTSISLGNTEMYVYYK